MKFHTFTIDDLFAVKSGDYHALSELDPGDVPPISCGDLSNGLVGYYDIPAARQYENVLTVAYNGSWPLTTKYHPYKFGAKDDVAVLVPRQPMKECVLLFVASLLNRMIWRYSYGRKCFRSKLKNVTVDLPVKGAGANIEVDDKVPAKLLSAALVEVNRGVASAVATLPDGT